MELYQKYKEKSNEATGMRNLINGALNRIAISDSEEEVERVFKILIEEHIPKYKQVAREAYYTFTEYNKQLIKEYIELK